MVRKKSLGIAAALLLAGCASAPRFHEGQALIKGETPVFPPAPDSLRCELELTAFGGGRKSSVSAAFSARPASAYKLDLFGLPGMVAGSFLWTPEKWTLVVFDRDEYGEGAGEHVEIGNLGLREVSVHDVFSFLWGDFFPGAVRSAAGVRNDTTGDLFDTAGARRDTAGARRDTAGARQRPLTGVPGEMIRDGENAFRYPGRDARWRITLDPKTGLVREAAREDSAFRIVYGEYKRVSAGGSAATGASAASPAASDPGRPVPHRVKLYRYREQVLEIRVKSLEDHPRWRRDPFFIKVPRGFRRV